LTGGKKVALYARVSTTDQTAENQLLDLRKYCSARGWEVVEPPYVDTGFSGSKADRPALSRLMDDVRKRRVDRVLVWRFDRFARSVAHLALAVQEFNDRDIAFTSYQEGVDTSTAQGRMFVAIAAAFAEFERHLLIERIHAGLRRATLCRTCKHGAHLGRTCACSCTAYVSTKRLGRPSIPHETVAEILDEKNTGVSSRAVGLRLSVSKSLVNKVRRMALNPEKLPAPEPERRAMQRTA
jgi:DNA invertase Pin-like site-specific DNA recombinase